MLTPSEAIELLTGAARARVDINNEQPFLPKLSLDATIEVRAAELIAFQAERIREIFEASERYLGRARKAECSLLTIIALRGYTGGNMGRVAGYRVAADIAERGLGLTRERILSRMSEKLESHPDFRQSPSQAINCTLRMWEHAFDEVVE